MFENNFTKYKQKLISVAKVADKIITESTSSNMTNEWIDWTSSDTRVRTLNYRGNICNTNNYLNNNNQNLKNNITITSIAPKQFQTGGKPLLKQKGLYILST